MIKRNWWQLLKPIIVTMVGFILLGGGGYLPPATAQTAPDLTILTYNLSNGNRDYDAIAETIRAQNADVVLLQELWATPERRLTPLITADYPYHALHPVRPTRQSLAIYSRYPLLNENFNFYAPESSYIRAQIALDDQIITIYNVHLVNPVFGSNGLDPEANVDDVRQLLDYLASDDSTPLIVGGDFNMIDMGGSYDLMSARLVDSYRESGSGLGLTYPANRFLPLVRIDYVFHSPDIHSLSAEVISSSGGSDHFPLRVELALFP